MGERKPTARIPLGDIGQDLSPFPYVLILGQDDNERIMGEKLRDWSVSVQWNTELSALEQKQAKHREPRWLPIGRSDSPRAVRRCTLPRSTVFRIPRWRPRAGSPI